MEFDTIHRDNLCDQQFNPTFHENPYTTHVNDHEGRLYSVSHCFQLNNTTVEANPSSNFVYSTFDDPCDPFQACLDQNYMYGWTHNGQEYTMHNLHLERGRCMDDIVDANHSRAPFLTMDQYQMNEDFDYSDKNSPVFKILDQGSCLILDEHDGTQKTMQNAKRKRVIDNKNCIIQGQWTPEEDGLLVELVEKHGVRKWSSIAQMLPGRIGKQCRERWHNHLKPNIKKDRWSEEEDRVLIEAHRQLGNKWAEIARSLPGRSENTIKNHWNATKRRQLSSRKNKNKNNSKSNVNSSPLQNYIKSVISKPNDQGRGTSYSGSSSYTSGSVSPPLVVMENGGSLENENDESIIINGVISGHHMLPDLCLMDSQMQMQYDLQKEMDFMEMLACGYI